MNNNDNIDNMRNTTVFMNGQNHNDHNLNGQQDATVLNEQTVTGQTNNERSNIFFANLNNNPNTRGPGYRLLSVQGMETLQTFLREHGNECIKQFIKVG
ncbi:unnamed protein product [Brassicogethes aeneus]|uniref:Uncharacterized protein n=1 Tax=Brassicogethes aeneus TaxID=1431903 RepID=A0A9P0FLE9_BRAAE|nr:unnamed protein product [Brassicogethes aeneus]